MLYWILRRCKYYVLINTFICSVGILSYWITQIFSENIVGLYIATMVRIFAMISWFHWVSTFKPFLYGARRKHLKNEDKTRILYRIFWIIIPIECISYCTAANLIEQSSTISEEETLMTIWLVHFAEFIPKSLVFEVVFDFFHYLAHRVLHNVPWLYRNVHKRHHWHLHPSALSTYEQDGIDLLISTTLPLTLTSMLSFPFSRIQFEFLLAYKTFIEIAGHCGLELKGYSFPQFPPVNSLSVCLHANDHDLHHTHVKWNYAKRFALWDKVFGTFRSSR